MFLMVFQEKEYEMLEYTEAEMEQIKFEEHLQDSFEARQRELAELEQYIDHEEVDDDSNASWYDDERPEDAAQDEQWSDFVDLFQHNQHVDDYKLQQAMKELDAEG